MRTLFQFYMFIATLVLGNDKLTSYAYIYNIEKQTVRV
jgi:hypothetical protein